MKNIQGSGVLGDWYPGPGEDEGFPLHQSEEDCGSPPGRGNHPGTQDVCQ
jgi:hypothetical protein